MNAVLVWQGLIDSAKVRLVRRESVGSLSRPRGPLLVAEVETTDALGAPRWQAVDDLRHDSLLAAILLAVVVAGVDIMPKTEPKS